MLRLVFESETVEFLLPNALGLCRTGGKNYECGGAWQTRWMCEIRRSNTPLYYSALTVQTSCTNSLCTMPWLSKNAISIFFAFDFWKRSFFGRGEWSLTHLELWCFVSGLYTKHQLSSPVITLSRKFLSPLIMFNRFWHAAAHLSICSRVSACRANLEHSFRFFKFSLKIHRTPIFGMLNVSAINWDVTFRSSLTILSTAALLSSVRLLVGWPLCSSSFTDSLPSQNHLCHFKNCTN